MEKHGGESRDLNDRVHGISCRYYKTSKQTYHNLLSTQHTFQKTKRTYHLIIRIKRSSPRYSTICSGFPHKSEQISFSVFRLCSDFCGKLLHVVEKDLDGCLE